VFGLVSPWQGLFQAGGGGEEKEEAEVMGEAKTRLEAIVEAED